MQLLLAISLGNRVFDLLLTKKQLDFELLFLNIHYFAQTSVDLFLRITFHFFQNPNYFI
jgi:hypothetical protein